MKFTIENISFVGIIDYIGPQYRASRKTSFNRPVSPIFINLIPQFCSIFYKDSYDTQLMAISSIIMRKKSVPGKKSNRVYGMLQWLTGSINRLINNR